jgi:NADH-quinone oxidoreductase subunit N
MSPVLAQATFSGPPVDWYALTPLIVLIAGGLVLMVVAALLPRGWPKGLMAALTATIAGASLVLDILLWVKVDDHGPINILGGAVSLDGFSLFVSITICLSVILVALLQDDYLRREDLEGVESYALLLMSAVGGIVLASASDLIVLFLGLETLSISLYVLAGSHWRRRRSQEAAMKYFILGSFSSAFLLYGIALIYGATGSTNLAFIANYLSSNILLNDSLLLAGIALLLVGLAFKVSAVPFHWWTPDVYEGSPSPVTAFMASAAKVAAFGAMLRVVVVALETYKTDWQPAIFVLAIITLLVGSMIAVVQTDVKRMLAYSSINHAGFILVGVEAGSNRGISGCLVYLGAYAVMVIGSFAVVGLVGRTGDGDHSLNAYRGLSRSHPLLALGFTVLLLAQAGVPFTSGFIAKLGVIGAAVDSRDYALAVVAMLAAVIAAFVYLRIVVAMYLADELPGDADREPVRVPFASGVAITLAVAFTLAVGFLPDWLVHVANDAVPVLASR